MLSRKPTRREKFVFRARDNALHRWRTLPTGARWGVAVGQAVSWALVDIDTPVTFFTMVDNIMVAAAEDQEGAFLAAVRHILERVRQANLLTSPDREEMSALSDEDLLELARRDNVFLGEEYHWLGDERVVRNSVKTVAKLKLALQMDRYSCGSFASAVSLMMYGLHTTRLNPAEAFHLLSAYRATFRLVDRGWDWDDELPYVARGVREGMESLGERLVDNPWWSIADHVAATYDDKTYDAICYTGASADGWGTGVRYANGTTDAFQQQWVADVNPWGRVCDDSSGFERGPNPLPNQLYFTAKRSAHAEPRAAMLLPQFLLDQGLVSRRAPMMRIAVVTEHFAIVKAQHKPNGYGGIGRGYTLNGLFAYTSQLFFHEKVQVVYSYITGPRNPADGVSRNFLSSTTATSITRHKADDIAIPLLRPTYSPVCEAASLALTPDR